MQRVGDVKEGTIVSGVPAKAVGALGLHVEILKARNAKYPWRELIEKRTGDFDAGLEPRLRRMRSEFFYGARDDG